MATSFLHCSTCSTCASFSNTKINHPYLSYKPSQNLSSWATINNDVKAHIEHALSGLKHAPVFEPMHHLIFEAPRSMAPALCIAACEAVGGYKEQAIAAASALHLMHAAAYTHQNLQLSDHFSPNNMAHHAFGPKIELLTGNAILPFGYELLAGLEDDTTNNPERILRAIQEISHAMGSQGMVEGQFKEMACTGSDGDETCEVGWADDVIEKKEGGLYACGATCGAILGGGSDEEVEILRRYGLYVGKIQGIMLHGNGTEENKWLEVMEGLRSLAIKELDSLKRRNVESLLSFINGSAIFPIV